VAAMRARAVPTWAAWLGVVAGILGIFSILFFTQAAIGIWIVIVSGGMFFRSMSGDDTGAVSTPA